MSKGSSRRRCQVSRTQFEDNWDAVFGNNGGIWPNDNSVVEYGEPQLSLDATPEAMAIWEENWAKCVAVMEKDFHAKLAAWEYQDFIVPLKSSDSFTLKDQK